MKMLVKNHLKVPITVYPGDHIMVTHHDNNGQRVMADIKIDESDTFDTAFVMQLEPGDLGFEAGYIGGVAREM